jgi:hypothetical protein
MDNLAETFLPIIAKIIFAVRGRSMWLQSAGGMQFDGHLWTTFY